MGPALAPVVVAEAAVVEAAVAEAVDTLAEAGPERHLEVETAAAVAVAAVDIVAAAAVITKTDIFADTLAVVHSG